MSLTGEEAKQLAEMFASQADHPSVTAAKLAGTADAVADLESPLVACLVDDEEPKFCFESDPKGVGIGDPEDTIDPERGGIFMFTNLRVFLLMGCSDGDKSRSLGYGSIAKADFQLGMRRHRIELAYEGTNYYLWLPTTFDDDAISMAVEYVTYRHKQKVPDKETTDATDDDGPESIRERLERLGDAKSRGLIEEEEYQRRKDELLRLQEKRESE